MINDDFNETEESNKDNSVLEATNTENSTDQPAEEITASTEASAALAASPDTLEAAPDEAIASENPASEITEIASPEEPAAVIEPETAAPDQTAAAPEVQTTPDQSAAAQEAESAEMDFGAILKEFEQDQEVFHVGKLVEGTVVGISDRGVLIDFGYKSEGLVPSDEFANPEGEVNVKAGEKVEVMIKSIYSGDAPPTLSYLDALRRKSWDTIETAFNEEQPIIAYAVAKTKGGLRMDINGVEAFLPGSQVDSRPVRNLDSYLGKELEAKVIKFSRKRNNIVISRKVLTDQVVNLQKAETLSKIEEGYVVDGVVKNLTEYGAFVDLGGIDGLLHVTDMSWGRIQNPGDHLKVNDQVQVKILKLDREREKISLGLKQLLPDPWSTVVDVYPVDSTVKGIISSVTDYGAFVELEPGVEGLVHVSEMSWSKRTKNPKKLVRPGQEVEVHVLGIDTDDRRISLGMKQLQDNPWDTIAQRYQVGTRVTGKVRNLTDFGAFIEIEDGIDGLVHVSDISHSKKIKHPKDVLKKDQEVEAIVTNVDTQGQRLSLSIKDLTPSTWDAFIESHRPGDVVRGKVSRFAGFGVFVELGNDLEGLCHISELAEERVEKPEDVVSIGQELDFKILRIEHEVQKIGLSARAVGKAAEPAVDTKMYSSEAKSGMASLGELINLKRGGQDDAAETADEGPKLSKKERRAKKAQQTAAAEESGEMSETPVASPEPDEAVGAEDAAILETAESAAEVDAEKIEEAVEAPTEETAVADTIAEEPAAETNEKAVELFDEPAPEADTAAQEASVVDPPAPENTEETAVETAVETPEPATAGIEQAEPAESPEPEMAEAEPSEPEKAEAKPKTAAKAKKPAKKAAVTVEPVAEAEPNDASDAQTVEENTESEEKTA